MSEVFQYQQYNNQYKQYKTAQVRALVWSLLSPAVSIKSAQYPACIEPQWCEQLYAQIKMQLEQLDQAPQPLLNWLDQYRSWRLGIRFEAYWAYILELLKENGQILAWASHIQINNISGSVARSKVMHTKGELDFVYLDREEQFYHLELAVKFYLLKPDEFGYERLIGPNGQDWYERKLIHLFQKQLALSTTQEARDKLAQLDEFKPFQKDEIHCLQQGLIKGMFFLPVTGTGEFNKHEQQCSNPDALTGLWATQDNWALSDPGQTGYWVILEKLNWLVPQVFSSWQEKLYTFKEMDYKIKIHFHATKRSLLIARLDFDEQQQLWLEQQRIMVVDRYWPSYKKPSKDNMTVKKIKETEKNTGAENSSGIDFDKHEIEVIPVNA